MGVTIILPIIGERERERETYKYQKKLTFVKRDKYIEYLIYKHQMCGSILALMFSFSRDFWTYSMVAYRFLPSAKQKAKRKKERNSLVARGLCHCPCVMTPRGIISLPTEGGV